MKHLWAHWEKVKSCLEGRSILLFLDYDGTLTQIVRDPAKARLSSARQKLLREMTHWPGLKIALVSGRSLKDLKKLVAVPGLIYAGNHGLEFKLGRASAVYPKILSWKPFLKSLAGCLEVSLKAFAGARVENKEFTLSVHYRCLLPGKIRAAKKTLEAILRSHSKFSKLEVFEGKKVWEIRPPVPWNKGHMVQWLLSQTDGLATTPLFPVYIGDDRTDEDAFKVLKQKGLGIKVTRHPSETSAAACYLRSPGEVFIFLKRIKELKNGRSKFHARG